MPAELVLSPIVPTQCPKLRLARELLREEQIADFHAQRINRQQAAIGRWYAAPAKGGNSAFFQLGVDLRGAGMTMPDIETVLHREAASARHPAERRDQIKGIMRTLRHGLRAVA